jgi:hypothetical protein
MNGREGVVKESAIGEEESCPVSTLGRLEHVEGESEGTYEFSCGDVVDADDKVVTRRRQQVTVTCQLQRRHPHTHLHHNMTR